MRFSYITDVLETLTLRDIRQKYRIRNAEQLKRSCEFLMDNVGNISSIKGMAAELSRANLTISDKTLAVYIDYLCNAFAFYRVRRFDVTVRNTCQRETNIIWRTIRFATLSLERKSSILCANRHSQKYVSELTVHHPP